VSSKRLVTQNPLFSNGIKEDITNTDVSNNNGEYSNHNGIGLNGKKRANDLDGKTWTKYSISIWSDIKKTREEVALGHPAIFPIALVSRLIRVFTNSNQKVIFDPFAGIGSTVVAAQRLGKQGIGIEISPEYALKARKRLGQKTLENHDSEGIIYNVNALDMLNYVGENTVDLVVTSPPYWNILSEKRSADYKEIRNYGNLEGDLSSIENYDDFLKELKKVFECVYKVMREGAYCCVIVMDIRKKNNFYPFHSDIASFMKDIGFIYDDIIIWDRRHEYNNMRPLGYPAVFRVNKAHEYILIFQKPITKKDKEK